jgi:hypothetical protein
MSVPILQGRLSKANEGHADWEVEATGEARLVSAD